MARQKERDRRFDAFGLARDGGVLEGEVDAATLPRIEDRLTTRPVPLHWRIRGTRDASGRPALSVELDAVVPLQCQRCLETVEERVEQRTEVVLAHDESELASLDEEVASEVLLADEPLDPLTLVEDELLLGLPYIARHAEGCKVAQ
jgi:uncharacterized protein